jgi:hypothetical protein
MLCGNFIERGVKKLKLQDVDKVHFCRALDMRCGTCVEMDLGEVRELASVADRFQMTAIPLDEILTRHLNLRICGEVLSWSGQHGLRQSEAAARKLATERFEELAKTDGFMKMDEEALGGLLEDDRLISRNEEGGMGGCDGVEEVGGWAGARALACVEDPVSADGAFIMMEEWYLRSRVAGMAPAEDAEWMECVVEEALRAKAAHRDGSAFEFELLGPNSLDDRVGLGVLWADYAAGGEHRLKGHSSVVLAVAECEGRVCSGAYDGSIRVWSWTGEATDAPERWLGPEGRGDRIYALSAWEGRLISGHESGKLRAWNVVTGAAARAARSSGPIRGGAGAGCVRTTSGERLFRQLHQGVGGGSRLAMCVREDPAGPLRQHFVVGGMAGQGE